MSVPTNYYFYFDLDKYFNADAKVSSIVPFEFNFKWISANEYELSCPLKENIKFIGNKVEFTFENGKIIKGLRL